MAGVYISGIEMPNGGTIKIEIGYDTDGHPMAMTEDYSVYDAITIPDHGRLGDLDRILEIIDGIWDCNDMVFKPNDHCCDMPKDCRGCKWAETKRAIREIVANAPTVIPADRKEKRGQ